MRKLNIVLALGLLATGIANAVEIKDPQAPQAPFNGRSPTSTGGPDAFGYTFLDSAESGCSFQFVDISGTGTAVISGDDSGATVALPGPAFNLYGTTYSQLNAATNGYLSTDATDTGPDLSNDCPLPVTPSTGGGARIYPLHDDLISDIVFQHFTTCPRDSGYGQPEGCYVFQWNATHFGGSEAPWRFQAILYTTSFGIAFQHDSGNPENGSGSTTGLQNDGATDGLTHSCNTPASIPASSAQCFVHPSFPLGSGFVPRTAVPATSPLMLTLLALIAAGFAAVAVRRRGIGET